MKTLTWAVKRSFVDYIAAVGGTIEMSGVTSGDDGFVFPAGPDGAGFTGEVRFSAHGEMLSVVIRDPELLVTDEGTSLTVSAENGDRVVVALLRSDEKTDGGFGVELTRAGARLFDDHYPTGAQMEPLQISAPQAAAAPTIAIIGSGPSGCYTAQALLRMRPDARIVVFDRMPVPYGLVRYGIAPDHQGRKAVTKQFDRLFERDGVVFVGNADVGGEVSFDRVRSAFDATVLATGLTHDRELDVPGAHLPGVYRAGAFTGHLNGHPDWARTTHDPGRDVVVVGAGNVAVDVVRLLGKESHDFGGSDIHPEHAVSTLANGVQRITVLSRSSLADAKCDAAMIKELTRLGGVRIRVSGASGAEESAVARAVLDASLASPSQPPRLDIELRFHAAPVEIIGQDGVQGVRISGPDGEVTLPATSVISAIGFHAGASELPVGDDVFPVGWAHYGPRGALPEARQDARRAAAAVCDYLDLADTSVLRPGLEAVLPQLAAATDFTGWRRVDAAEQAAAQPGRIRQKLLTRDDILAVALPTS